MRLRLVSATVRPPAVSGLDSWSASGNAISTPAIATSIHPARFWCHSQNQPKATTMAAANPRLRLVWRTDRTDSGSPESMLKASSTPNGIRPNIPNSGSNSATPNTAAATTVSTTLRRSLGCRTGGENRLVSPAAPGSGTTASAIGMSSGRVTRASGLCVGSNPPANEASSHRCGSATRYRTLHWTKPADHTKAIKPKRPANPNDTTPTSTTMLPTAADSRSPEAMGPKGVIVWSDRAADGWEHLLMAAGDGRDDHLVDVGCMDPCVAGATCRSSAIARRISAG